MASKPPLKFAVAGLGVMGQRHCQILQSVPGAELYGVFDRTEDLARRVGEQYGVQAYPEFDQLVEDFEVDAVVLCLPSALHAMYGVAAAMYGKNVVAEKPLDADSRSARSLFKECQAAGVQCATISQYRFSDGIWAVKQAYDQGDLGDITLARASIKWFRHDEYYTESDWRGKRTGELGGVLMNQAVHAIDILQWFFGKPVNVRGFTSCSRPDVLEMEDTAAVAFRFPKNILATLEASTCAAPGFDDVYEFQGPKASVTIRKGQILNWYHADGLPQPEPDDFGEGEGLDPKLQLFWRQYQNVVAAIRRTDELLVTPREAIAVVETVEQIYKEVGPA